MICGPHSPETGDFYFGTIRDVSFGIYNHALLLDGSWISRAAFSWFDHLDNAHLEREMAAVVDRQLIFIVGTFSMEPDWSVKPLRG